jgi:thioredoxin reductase
VNIYYVEQDVTLLKGEYLTESVVVCGTEQEALAAALALEDDVEGFGLVVRKDRLKVSLLGKLTLPRRDITPRFEHDNALVLAVGTAKDEDY